jgi:hypothetical protein
VVTDIRQQDLFPKEAPMWHTGLTGRRRMFVEYYCKDKGCLFNATAAYIKAYGSVKQLSDSSIQSNSSRMMRDPKIKDAIARLLRSCQNEKDQITEYKLLDILETLSTYKTSDIIDDSGNLKKSLEEMGPLSICVAGIKRTRGGGKEIKLYDRTKGIALLCNYLRMTRPEEGATVINPVVMLTEKDFEVTRGDEKTKETPEAQDADYELTEA